MSDRSSAGVAEPRGDRKRWIVKGVLMLAALIAILFLGREMGGYVVVFTDWVEGLGRLGPLAFIMGYALATVAFVPGSLLTMAAGAVFGVLSGALYVLAG